MAYNGRMTPRVLSLALVALAALLGCRSTIRYNRFENRVRSPNPNVEVFMDPSAIPYPYKMIGMLSVDDNAWGWSEAALLDRALNEGYRLGADAIVLRPQDKTVEGHFRNLAINRRVVRVGLIVRTLSTTSGSSEGSTPPSAQGEGSPPAKRSVARELRELKQLLDEGVLTKEEFEIQKARVLQMPAASSGDQQLAIEAEHGTESQATTYGSGPPEATSAQSQSNE